MSNVTAPVVIGPASFVYIDIDSSDAVSALITVIKNDVESFKLSQNGTIQLLGSIVQSNLDGLTD